MRVGATGGAPLRDKPASYTGVDSAGRGWGGVGGWESHPRQKKKPAENGGRDISEYYSANMGLER